MSVDTRGRILEACERVIAAGGLARFRMTAVAQEAGVSIGLLSYHFGDRDGLLQAALDHVNESAERRAATLPAGSSAAERLATLLCSEIVDDAQVRAGSTAWNELRAAAVFDADRATALSHSTSAWQARVRSLVTECGVPEDEADTTALTLTSLVEGLSGRWLTGQITAKSAHAAIRHSIHRLM